MTGTFGITGIPPPEGAKVKTVKIPYAVNMPLRYEVSDPRWSTDASLQKQWTLFILGLEKFQKMPVNDKLSYFQVAGIHGYPETVWDGAPPPKEDPVSDPSKPGDYPYGGYCHHNTVAFPTWHRPYLLLFEQCIWLNMKEIVKSWHLDPSEEKIWLDAANNWRLPYWDYAQTPVPALPHSFTIEKIHIWPPASVKIENPYPSPLWGFRNPETDSDGKPRKFGSMPPGKEKWNIKADLLNDPQIPWDQCSGVSRYGLNLKDGAYSGLEGINDVKVTNAALADFKDEWYDHLPGNPDNPAGDPGLGTLQDAAKRMLTQGHFTSWGAFSSTKWNAELEVKEYLSLEFIHNNVHNLTGGSVFVVPEGSKFLPGIGHMCDVPVAAFDPIFWLHHVNVDRWAAIFQILNWDLWFDQEPSEQTYKVVNGERIPIKLVPDVKSTDPLIPFHTKDDGDPKGDFWTSDMVRDWTRLHYQYDDLVPAADAINQDGTLNETKYIADIQAHVNKIYTGTGKLIKSIMVSKDISNEEFLGVDDGTWNDYLINVVYDRYALQGRSYSIVFHLGGKKGDAESAFNNPKNYIGQVYNFAGLPPRSTSSAEGTGCANCGVQNDGAVLSSAQVAITSAVVRKALDDKVKDLQTITRDEVTQYLADHLHWKFFKMGGTEVSASELPQTQISVWCGRGSLRDRKPAKYTNYEPLSEVTNDKPCGVSAVASG